MSEQAFLNALAQNPQDDSLRLVYADWLEERGDPRGEFLRLTSTVRQENLPTPELREQVEIIAKELVQRRNFQRTERLAHHEHPDLPPNEAIQQANDLRIEELQKQLEEIGKNLQPKYNAKWDRLQELAAQFDPKWNALVSDPIVEGCGLTLGVGMFAWRLRMDFVCDKRWSDMSPTDDPKVRTCNTCHHNVHYCDNIAEARAHAHDQHCIAIDIGIPRKHPAFSEQGRLETDIAMFGNPSRQSYVDLWEKEHVDPVSKKRMAARSREEIEKFHGREQVVWVQQDNIWTTPDGVYQLRPRPRRKNERHKHTEQEYDVWSTKERGPSIRPWLGEDPRPADGYIEWRIVDKATRDYFGVAEKDRREDGTWLGWV